MLCYVNISIIIHHIKSIRGFKMKKFELYSTCATVT
nr:MAG TPA: hypothetical protein [Caudoviricetes sp.]